MIARVAFFVLMALGLIGFGTVAWVTTRPTGPQVPVTKVVLVASQPIDAGSLLTSDVIAPMEIPSDQMQSEYNLDTPDNRRLLMGAMMKRKLAMGEAIRNDDLMRPSDHGFMAAVLSPGMRAVTISVDAASGSSGLIWPGDRVDLILTQMSANTATPLGRRISAQTVLTNVRVVAVDAQLVGGGTKGATPASQDRTVTLEVDEEQAQRVAVAMRLGRLSVSVRAASAQSNAVAKTGTKRDATFASDVLPELEEKQEAPVIVKAAPAAPAPVAPPMRVFSGPDQAKEFKF
jgi:pilus assembly protein CpaB